MNPKLFLSNFQNNNYMNKLVFISFFLIFALINIHAQAPSKFNYQAVARDNAGNPISNKFISIRASIVNGSPTGVEVYKELFLISTNDFGHFNLSIGGGNPSLGTFSAINWEVDDKYLKIELDVTGASNFILMGSTQLLSVPYALNSKYTSSLASTAKINLDQINGNTATTGNILAWSGSKWTPTSSSVIPGDNWGTQSVQSSSVLSGSGTLASKLTLAQQGATTGQVLQWNGTTWIPATIAGGTDNWGSQTAVTSGALTGNGTTGNPISLSQQGATTNQVLKWDGSSWTPANETGSDNWGSQSAITSGALIGNGTTGSPISLSQQGATNGQILKWNGTAWIPAKDSLGSDNWGSQSAITSGALTGNGTSGNPIILSQQGAANGQILKWNGTTWLPANDSLGTDNWGTQSTVTNATLSGNGLTANPLAIAQQGATTGQVLRWNGTAWVPSTLSGSGPGDDWGIQSVVSNSSLIGIGTIGSRLGVDSTWIAKKINQSPVKDSIVSLINASSTSTTAANGLTKTGNNIALGGSLIGATSITTTANNSLAVNGLLSGSTTDSIVVSDATTGILKRISPSRIAGSTYTSSNGLSLSGTNFTIGGPLVSATTISTSVNNTFALSGIQSGTIADSILVSDASTGIIKRISSSRISSGTSGLSSANNGLSTSGTNVSLGGSLVSATTIATSVNGTLALSGIQSGTIADSILVSDAATGIIKRISSSRISSGGGGSVTANNGLSLSGSNVSLGGPLSSATTISTSGANTIALSGIQSGSIADSLLVSDATSGVVKRISASRISSGGGGSVTANNGLSLSGSNVSLGGPLSSATTITTSGANTIAFSGIQSGTISDSILVSDAASGVIKRISASRISTGGSGSYTASNGIVLTGSNFSLGGTMTAPVTITTSQINNIALAGLWSGFDNDSILTSNAANGIINRQSRDRVNYWKKDAFGNINFANDKVSIGTAVAKTKFFVNHSSTIGDTTAMILTNGTSTAGNVSLAVTNINTNLSAGVGVLGSAGFIGVRGVGQGISNSNLGTHIGVNGVAIGNNLGTMYGVNGVADSSGFSVGVRGTGHSIGILSNVVTTSAQNIILGFGFADTMKASILGYTSGSNNSFLNANVGTMGVANSSNTWANIGLNGIAKAPSAGTGSAYTIGVLAEAQGGSANQIAVLGWIDSTITGSSVYAGYFNNRTRVGGKLIVDDTIIGLKGLKVSGARSTFSDSVRINSNLFVNGTLSKAAGTFRIDHPQDPENKYLVHSFVESPDMMNVYNGNITTDKDGFATVTLPSYFESLNKDFRYQLTVLGTFAQAIIKDKIKENSFIIQTDKPNIEVSWQITGIRKDPYAERYRIKDVEEKPAHEKGTYLHPEVYGKPKEKATHYTPEVTYPKVEKPEVDKVNGKVTNQAAEYENLLKY
jgi:hypothetical protein